MKKFMIFALLIATALLAVSHAQAQVLVIANPSVKASEISKNDLRDVFTGANPTLKDGTNVVLVLLKAGTTHEEFLKVYIGKPDSVYRAGWRSLVFSGQASMPKNVDGDAAVVDFVAHNKGAVGYIGKDAPHEGVKVLAVK